MYRDIAFALACVAAFATSVAYVAYPGRSRSDAQLVRIARLETAVLQLQKRGDTEVTLRSVAAQSDPPVGTSARGAPDRDALLGQLAPENAAPARAQAARLLLAAPNDGVRLYAAQVLLETDFEEGARAISSIVAAAKDRPSSMRTAVRALGLLAASRDAQVDAALRSYLEDSSPLVRVKAAKLLDEHGDPGPIGRATEQLVRDLESRDHRQRLESLALLGVAAQHSAISSIVPLLNDESSDIRMRAVLTLSRFEDPSLTPTILPLLNDPAQHVRTAAAQALRGNPR